MPYIAYESINYRKATRRTIAQVQEIIEEYVEDGYALTLRQLYYQMVARAMIPNKDSAYKRLGSVVAKACRTGHIDWEAIVDRTRNLRSQQHWGSPEEIVKGAVNSYRTDRWADQPVRVEVWIEKDALLGVLERPCHRLRVPYFSCRGYTSQSEMWKAGQRIRGYIEGGQKAIILHLGDHDPSGIDITRDIQNRLGMFVGGHYKDFHDGDELTKQEFTEQYCEVKRVALNMQQIQRLQPPPNPAKITDSRFEGYRKRFGNQSWELDALSPPDFDDLITWEVENLRNEAAWQASIEKEEAGRDRLRGLVDHLEGT